MRAWDVVVAGSGPAGCAAAAACARQGLRTLLVAPAPERVWPQTYGLWWDEVEAGVRGLALGGPARLARRLDAPVVRTCSRGERRLAPAYAVLDNAGLHAALAAVGGVERRAGRVVDVVDEGHTAYAVLADGTRLPAAVVVDATGRRDPGRAQQRAWGEVVTGAEALVPRGSAVFMDWATPATLREAGNGAVFVYGMDVGDGRALVELTSLAAAPPRPLADLRTGLHALLAAVGARPVGRSERVAIPLGPVPARDTSAAVRFGAAAGLVHPATGYSVATALRLAPVLAGGIADALGGPSAARGAAVARAVLPRSRRATLGLLTRGLEVLLPLDQAGCDTFFGAFLDLPPATWRPYLDPTSPPAAVARAMGATLRALPWALRVHTVRTVLHV